MRGSVLRDAISTATTTTRQFFYLWLDYIAICHTILVKLSHEEEEQASRGAYYRIAVIFTAGTILVQNPFKKPPPKM